MQLSATKILARIISPQPSIQNCLAGKKKKKKAKAQLLTSSILLLRQYYRYSRTLLIQIDWSNTTFQRTKSLCCQIQSYIPFRHITEASFPWKGMHFILQTRRDTNFYKHALTTSALAGILVRAAEAAVWTGRIPLFRRLLDKHCPALPLKFVVWDRGNKTKALQLCHFI